MVRKVFSGILYLFLSICLFAGAIGSAIYNLEEHQRSSSSSSWSNNEKDWQNSGQGNWWSWDSGSDSGSLDSWDSGSDSGSWDSWDSGSDSGGWDSWDSGSDSGSWDSDW